MTDRQTRKVKIRVAKAERSRTNNIHFARLTTDNNNNNNNIVLCPRSVSMAGQRYSLVAIMGTGILSDPIEHQIATLARGRPGFTLFTSPLLPCFHPSPSLFPSLPSPLFSPPALPFPSLSFPFFSPRLPPPPLEVGPLNTARDLGEVL